MPVDLLLPVAVVFGLIVGSFLNVVAHRVPRSESIVFPASRCPYCNGKIAARDNVPVLSYLLLRGRCRRCAAPISARYPFIEALTALLFAAAVWRFGWSSESLVAILFCALLVALAAIDAERMILPDKITLPAIVAGLALQPFFAPTRFLDAVVGTLIGAGAIVLLVNFWYWWRGEEGMGMGDVNMLAMIGAFLGWQGAVVALVAGAAAGALIGLALILAGRLGFRSKMPFGVYLAFGALFALFGGRELFAAYLALQGL